MGDKTKIEWCDFTFNPIIGCAKVSPGCAHCYAENETFARVRRSRGQELWGKGAARVRTSKDNWGKPVNWNKYSVICETCEQWLPYVRWSSLDPHTAMCPRCSDHQRMIARRPRVFCASMGDWLDKEIPIEWFADLLKLIHYTPNLDWLLLTKRPGNWFERIRKARNWLTTGGDADVAVWLHDWLPNPAVEGGQRRNQQATRSRWSKPGIPPRNVWIGTSVEDQQRADERIPELLKIPARVRFLSVEPMLGPIDFPRAAPCGYYCDHDEFGGGHRPGHGLSGIHWVIFGGESGPKARPCNAEWIRDGVRQCRSAGVAPFVKQLGADPRINMSHEMLASDLDRMNQAIAAAGGSVMTQDEWDRHRCNVPLTLRCRKGGEMSKWPEDLRIREFPTIPA